MTTAVKLISQLGATGIQLWLDDQQQLRFRAPKGAMTDELKQAVIEHKQDIIRFLQQTRHNTGTIARIEREAESLHPLSFAQQRFWFLDNMQPGNPSLNIPAVLSINGSLNINALHTALQQLSARHESLRTIFVKRDNQEPAQQVLPALSIPLQLDHDLSVLDNNAQQQQLQQLIRQQALQAFTLSSSSDNPSPLLRLQLIRLSQQQHYLLLTLHHMIADGWSVRLLIQELTAFYRAAADATPAHFPELPVQYIDYVHWQQQQLQHENQQQQLLYWQQQLQQVPVLDLPLDFPRPRQSSANGASYQLALDKTLLANINTLALRYNTTGFSVLLSAFALLLYRYSGQTDFCIGTPVAGRQQQELESVIGCFINLLAIRQNIDSAQPFSALLRQTAQTLLAAQENQSIPFEKVAEHCVSERSTAHTPLFQVLFTHQQQLPDQFSVAGLDIQLQPQASFTAKYDLQLHINEQADNSSVWIEYNRDLFLPQTIADFARHFTLLLQQITEHSEQPIKTLSIYDDQDLVLLQAPTQLTTPATTLSTLLQDSLNQHANNTAVQQGGNSITLEKLHRNAAIIARHLQQHGVKAGDRVGLLLPAGCEQMSAMLAIIQCHACYVPMDVRYPDDRLKHMISNAAMALVITDDTLKTRIADSVPLLISNQLPALAAEFHPPAATDDQLLYLIYTSGSTGLPKGAGVSRANEVNLLQWYIAEYGFSAQDRFLVFSALGFDLTQKNLLAPLMCGAQLVFPENALYDPEHLLSLIAQHSITVINCAPSAFYPLIDLALRTNRLAHMQSLRHVLFGGEPLISENLLPWLNSEYCHARISNMYGPTECTDISCAWTLSKDDFSTNSIPIGQRINGVYTYILDADMNPVPPGVNGELYIGGDSVGSGYFNQPALNHGSFIDNPFGEGLLYRTRDQVRYMRRYWPQPVLEFTARIDDQIKIRGFRVEPGEIANRLMQAKGVREAKVFADDQQQKLIAYYITEQQPLQPQALREYLRQHLPDYMVPSAFVDISAWPLSANGKIDRKQLPTPQAQHTVQRQSEAPATLLQQQLSTLWQAALAIDNIGIHDNFFELGGHSLTATRLIAQINQTHGCDVPLAQFFSEPTIAATAAFIEQGSHIETAASLLITRADRNQPIPLSYAQQRLWIIEQLSPGNSAYHIPLALKINGALNLAALKSAIQQIIERHESLRTRIVTDTNGNALQQIMPACEFILDEQDISQAADVNTQLQQQINQIANTAFNLANDWLIRAALLKCAEQSHVLVVCLHHIIADGWSLSILQQELSALYYAEINNLPAMLTELPVQYADFSVWQQQQLQQEKQQQHLQYWLKQLDGIPACIHLPFDRARPAQQTFTGAMHSYDLPQDISRRLKSFSQQQGVSLYTTLLSLYSLLLNKYSQQQDICIGTPVAGRDIAALQNLIGYFVNAVVIRSDLSGNPDFTTLVQRTHQTALAAFANQDIPVEQVLDKLQLERNLSYPPVAQTGFSYISHDLVQPLQLDQLQVEPLDIEKIVAKYELTFIVIEQANGLQLNIEYNSDLFNAATIDAMAQHFITLAQHAAEKADCGIDNLSLLTAEEIAGLIDIDAQQLEAVHPLTTMQKDMVMNQWLQPLSLANTLGYRAELNTFVDADIWRNACQITCDAEPVTRTVFCINPQPFGDFAWQCVLRQLDITLEVLDYRHEAADEATIDRYVADFIYRPDAYLNKQFIRYGLMRISDTRTILLLSSHHALLDGIAIVLIAQQTARHYEALHNALQLDASVSNNAIPVYHQQDRQKRDNYDAQQFWKQAFSHCEALDFPAAACSDVPQQIIRTQALSPALTQQIKQFCKQHRMTSAQLLKLVYGLLISHYCRADNNFYFSEFNAGRSHDNAFSLGCFFEQSPFIFPAARLQSESRIQDLFEDLRTFRKAIKPYDALSLGMTRKLAPAGRLHFMYNYYHFFPQQQTMLGHQITCIEMPPFIDNTVQFIAKEHEQHISLDLYYQSHVFADLQFLPRMQSLLQQLVNGTEQLADLSLLLPGEHVLHGATVPLPANISAVQQLIEQQVNNTPQAIAISDDAGDITYQALNQQANQLAHYLLQQGVKKGDTLAICLPRNRHAIIAILATIKSGAVYVPVDSSYPPQRIQHILQQANIRLLISDYATAQNLPHSDIPNVLVDVAADTLAQQESRNLPVITNITDPLYIIFTSGSTGLPKGAQLSHQGEINLLQWYIRNSEFTASSRTLIISALGFDLTQKNLFAPLACGGTLVLSELPHYDSDKIRQLIQHHKITHINCAPSAFYPLTENNSAMLSSLQQVILGGEAIQPKRMANWLATEHCKARLTNHYGPTECTDIALYYHVPDNTLANNTDIPLGKPNDNISVYLMNRFMQPLPSGLTGELCIAGSGVGLGYIGNAQANSEKFLKLPDGSAIYRTGDLARQQHDGNITFAGRTDFQLKLNGLRIEPGEIEQALKQISGVNDALVIAHNNRLVAYLQGSDIDSTLCKQQLTGSLPAYMVPAVYISVAQWPLTANGKIDRKALPSPDQAVQQIAYVAPRDDIEQAICDIVRRVLNIDRVGIHDNFFDLGGHSLAASRAMVQIREHFGIEIPLTILFDMTSAEKLADYIRAAQWATQSAESHNNEEGRDTGFI